MKKIVFYPRLCIDCWQVFTAQDSLISRIVLVGDGGQFTEGKHPVSEAIKKFVPLDG